MTSLCRRLPAAGAALPFGKVRVLHPARSAAICGVRYVYSPNLPIAIRLRRRHPTLVAATTGHSGERSKKRESDGGGKEGEKARPQSFEQKSVNQAVKVVVAAAVTVVMGVGNRVLYKLALVPLKQYPFFLAQLATFGYVIVYFSILYIRYRAGIVTDEMLSMPKTPFLVVGLLEALGAATGMAAGAMLSGASIPILSQTFLVWQILLSIIFLGRRYKVNQLLGCFLVAIGVVTTVASGSGAGQSLKEAGIFWSLLMMASFLFQAADTVLKEVIFLDATRRLKGGSVDLFVVNSFGSAFQALFICLLLPFLSKLWGIPFSQLPNYLKDGAACFLNVGMLSSDLVFRMRWCPPAALAVYYCQHGLQYLVALSPQDLFGCCLLSSLHVLSPNIYLCVHAAIAIPWCCRISSNRLSCWSHHSHHGITHLYMDPFKCFLQCFLDGSHLEKPGGILNLVSCTIPSNPEYRLQLSS